MSEKLFYAQLETLSFNNDNFHQTVSQAIFHGILFLKKLFFYFWHPPLKNFTLLNGRVFSAFPSSTAAL